MKYGQDKSSNVQVKNFIDDSFIQLIFKFVNYFRFKKIRQIKNKIRKK